MPHQPIYKSSNTNNTHIGKLANVFLSRVKLAIGSFVKKSSRKYTVYR